MSDVPVRGAPVGNAPNDVAPQANASIESAPIRDITYRGYDGPLITRRIRWWIVTVAMLRQLVRNPWFWVIAAFGCLPHFIFAIVLYFSTQPEADPTHNVIKAQHFGDNFYTVLTWQWLPIYVIALIAGAGSIAADNRSNALLVYLSKPLTKGDYLLGKWAGIFLAVFGIAIVPALVLYGDCALTFASDGFFKNEPWLIVGIVLSCMLPAVMHASLIVGFSAWSRTPRMVSAVYSGVYFFTWIVSSVVGGGQWKHRHELTRRQLVIRHMSVDGIYQGLAQDLLGAHKTLLIKNLQFVPWRPLVIVGVIICVGGVVAARVKIRAVEVVRG